MSVRAKRWKLAQERGLPRLRALLALLQPPKRRSLVERMSVELRRALIQHMEVTGSKSPIPPPAEVKGRPKLPTTSRSRKAKAPKHTETSHGSQRKKVPTGICTVKTPWGPRHFARITIAGIAISSRSTCCLAEASDFRRRLLRLQETVTAEHLKASASAGQGGPPASVTDVGERLREALGNAQPGGDDEDTADGLGGLHLRFWATINARRWIGRTLSSPQVSSVAQAIDLRRRFEEARQHGWPALRAEWKQCLQAERSSGRFGRRSMGHEEAEAHIEEALERYEHRAAARSNAVHRVSAARLPAAMHGAGPAASSHAHMRGERRLQKEKERLARQEARMHCAEVRACKLMARLDRTLQQALREVRQCRKRALQSCALAQAVRAQGCAARHESASCPHRSFHDRTKHRRTV